MSPTKKKTETLPKKKAVKKPKEKKAASSPLKTTSSPVSKPKTNQFSPEIKVFPSAGNLYEEMAPMVMMAAREAVDARGRFILALSGGNTPKPLYQQLAEEPYVNLMPWAKTFIFWADERHVPLDSPESNYRLALDHLFGKAPIPKTNLFQAAYPTLPVDQAAYQYERKLKKFFGQAEIPRIDLCLLGMGEDGHTASLFPGVQQLNEQKHWVEGYFVNDKRKERITLTFPVLNAAGLVWVLATGKKKAEIIKEVLEGPSDPPRYPIQYLRPTDGKLLFALDNEAASLLKK